MAYLANDRDAVFAITAFDKLEIVVTTSSSACEIGGTKRLAESFPIKAGSQGGICDRDEHNDGFVRTRHTEMNL